MKTIFLLIPRQKGHPPLQQHLLHRPCCDDGGQRDRQVLRDHHCGQVYSGHLRRLECFQLCKLKRRSRLISLICLFLSSGLSSNVVPMYLGELSPKNLRGALGIVPQLFITIGILSAQVLGIRNILGNSTGTDCHSSKCYSSFIGNRSTSLKTDLGDSGDLFWCGHLLKISVCVPSVSRLAPHAGFDWYSCSDRAPVAAFLPREPQVHAHPEG